MGVYIKGIEMPTTCAKCPLGHINAKRYAIECYAEYPTKLFDYDLARHSTNPFCPLIPVPPHGRLIDADELAALMYANIALFDSAPGRMGAEQKLVRAWLASMVDDINDAPTILEAEEG